MTTCHAGATTGEGEERVVRKVYFAEAIQHCMMIIVEERKFPVTREREGIGGAKRRRCNMLCSSMLQEQ